MEKIKCSYSKGADELNITLGRPRKAILAEIGDEIYVKLSPKTKKVLGFAILHFEERSKKRHEEPFTIPLNGYFEIPSPIKEQSLQPA